MIRLLSKIPERRGEVMISQERTSAFFNRASPIDFTAQSPSNFRWYISLRHFLLAAGEPSARQHLIRRDRQVGDGDTHSVEHGVGDGPGHGDVAAFTDAIDAIFLSGSGLGFPLD